MSEQPGYENKAEYVDLSKRHTESIEVAPVVPVEAPMATSMNATPSSGPEPQATPPTDFDG